MGEKLTRGLPPGRVEKRLIKVAGEAIRANCPNPERIGCPGAGQSKRWLGGVWSSHILTTSSIILQRALPVSRSIIASGSAQRLRNAGLSLLRLCGAAGARTPVANTARPNAHIPGSPRKTGAGTGAHRDARLQELDD